MILRIHVTVMLTTWKGWVATEKALFKRIKGGCSIPKLCFTLAFAIQLHYVMTCFESFKDHLIRVVFSVFFQATPITYIVDSLFPSKQSSMKIVSFFSSLRKGCPMMELSDTKGRGQL